MKRWFLTTAAILALPSMAMAADLAVRPTKAPAVVPQAPPTWTGFYVGGNLGWGWSNGDGTITFGAPAVGVPVSGNGNGFLGGVQAGYNWQTGPVVYGIETDFQGSSGKGSLDGAAGGVSITGSDLKNPWFGTVRGRIGYAPDSRWMVYFTGGGLYGRLNYSGTLAGVATGAGPFSGSDTYWTWTVGGGVETMLWDRWSAKLEYLYAGTPDNFPVPPGTAAISGSTNTNIVRAGLNYHF